jgi:hypothetical protein
MKVYKEDLLSPSIPVTPFQPQGILTAPYKTGSPNNFSSIYVLTHQLKKKKALNSIPE